MEETPCRSERTKGLQPPVRGLALLSVAAIGLSCIAAWRSSASEHLPSCLVRLAKVGDPGARVQAQRTDQPSSMKHLIVYYLPFTHETYQPVSRKTAKSRLYKLTLTDPRLTAWLTKTLGRSVAPCDFVEGKVRLLVEIPGATDPIFVNADGVVSRGSDSGYLAPRAFLDLYTRLAEPWAREASKDEIGPPVEGVM